MKSSLRTVLFLSSLAMLALTGCDNTKFLAEAGSEVDEGGFGQPTMMNSMAMMNADGAMLAIGHRFDAEVQPTITFAFDKSDLTPATMAVLDKQADWIRQFPEVRFSVYGHTDLVGSSAYNYALGLRRARTVVAYLESRGISGSRLQALVSYGKTRPVIHTDAPEERNRRTVTEVSGFARKYAGLLNGKYAEIIFRSYVASAGNVHAADSVSGASVNPTGKAGG